MTAEELIALRECVDRRGWRGQPGYPPHSNIEDAVLRLLDRTPAHCRKMMLGLIDKYVVIRDYIPHAVSLLRKLDAFSGDGGRYLIFPLRENTAGKVKSGHTMCYELEAVCSLLETADVTFADDPFSQRVITCDDRQLVAVDDFIGSGTQFSRMADQLIDAGARRQVSVAMCIAIQQIGRYELERRGATVLFEMERPKALSDSFAVGTYSVEEACALYDCVEALLSPPDDYKRGYERSEAIISLKKTPNNTLPVFWSDRQTQEGPWPAPFPRPRTKIA